MLKFLRILLRVTLTPFILLFSFALFIFEQLLCLIAGIGAIFSVIFAVYGIWCIFDPVYSWSAPPALISAFLISPFGVPLVGEFIIVGAESFRDWLKAI